MSSYIMATLTTYVLFISRIHHFFFNFLLLFIPNSLFQVITQDIVFLSHALKVGTLIIVSISEVRLFQRIITCFITYFKI